MKKSLEDLNKIYGFAYTEIVERGEKLHPIYLKHLKATWEIEAVYDLVHAEQISLGKARELTAAIIETFNQLPTDEQRNLVRDAYMAKWEEGNKEYPRNLALIYWSGINDGMVNLLNWMRLAAPPK
jgi:hypothetical protein